ncbi:MAG: hypothetical protein K6F75_12170, partial [Butyrivibrio sp.]|nr:hypothetical protein [Butyrivibrio sp.]
MKELNTRLFGGSIFKSIMSSYLIICGIILIGTMTGYLYNYRVINDNISSIAQQRSEISAANLDKEFAQLLTSIDNISSDRGLTKTLALSESEMGARIHELSELRNVILDNIHRNTIKEAYIYYFDTNSVFSTSSRLWNSKVIDSYIKNLGLEPEEFQEIVKFPGLYGGSIFDDGRIWVMENVYDDHYKKKAVIVFECLMSEIDVGEADETVTVLTDNVKDIYLSDQAQANIADDILIGEGEAVPAQIIKDRYYYVGANLTTMPWRVYVGTPKSSLYRSLRIFWAIFAIEFLGAIILTLFLSFKSTSRLWKPVQELLDVIQEKEDVGFMETFKGVNDKVSKIMSENSLMQRNVTKLEPYMYENRIGRILDGDIKSSDAVIKTFSEFTGVNEGNTWAMAMVRPQKEKQGALLKEKGTSVNDTADKDIMSFTLKNIIDELTGSTSSRVYKYGEDYLIFFTASSDAGPGAEDRAVFKAKLDEMRAFYEETLEEPIYIILSEIYTS